MHLRVGNNGPKPITVILEPWATEFVLEPNDYLNFKSHSPTPDGAYFLVENHEGYIVVIPEWDAALVHVYSSDGFLID